MTRLLFLILLLTTTIPLLACDITMGYRTSDRLPLIAAAPDNSGLYKTLFELAANKSGCTLTIKRAPKKRIIKLLKSGEIDFYPGLGFNEKRSKDFHFIKNGLTSHTVIITHLEIPEITNLEQLAQRVLLKPYGSRVSELENHKMRIRYGQDLGIYNAIKLLEKKQADVFIYNKASIQYHLAKNPSAKVKIHQCCFKPTPMYLGFSKRSKYFQAINNPNYDSTQPISPENLAYILAKESKANAFALALKELAENGTLKALEKRFYSDALDSEQTASSDISDTKH